MNLSKGQLRKKAGLLKKKILAEATITHNNYQYRIQALKDELEQAKKQLNQQIGQLGHSLLSIGEKYKNEIESLSKVGAENPNNVTNEILDAQQLKKYLNAQKAALKEMLQLQSIVKQPSESQKLHNLMRKKQLQQVLQQIQLKQLQKQVKYLSTHVINSSGLIYVPENAMTEAQENDLNSRLQIQLTELNRLIDLEVVCGTSPQTPTRNTTENYIDILNNQEKRLNIVFDLLANERETISQVEGSIGNFLDMAKNVPIYVPKTENKTSGLSKLAQTDTSNQQIERILSGFDFSQYSDLISNRTCTHDELSNNLKTLRNKIKKIQ